MIKDEKARLLNRLLSRRDNNSQFRLLAKEISRLSPEKATLVKQQLPAPESPEFGRKAREVRKELHKGIERRHRRLQELIPYEIDWNKRDGDLVTEFRTWIETNRAHDPHPRGGGHTTSPLELLKALGARRLMQFVKKHQKSMPHPFCVQTLHAALTDYSRHCRKEAGRPDQPLYEDRSGWNDAVKSADRFLTSL
jgi:hypothetical protein